MSFVYDNFVGSSGTDLNTISGWSRHPTATTQAISLTGANRSYSNVASGRSLYIHSWIPSKADYIVRCRLFYASSIFSTQIGLCGRLDPTNFTCYLAFFDDGSPTTINLYKVVSGSGTFLQGANSGFSAGESHELQLTMVGSTISVQVDGTTVLSTTDTSITAAGQAGFSDQNQMSSSTGMQAGSFYADDSAPNIINQPMGSLGTTIKNYTNADIAYKQMVVADRPTFYWPLDRTSFAEDYRITTSPVIGQYNGTVTASKGLGNGSQGISFSSTGTAYMAYNAAFNKAVFTAECWAYHTTVGAQFQYIMFLSSDFSSNGWALSYYPAHNAYDFQAYGVNDCLSNTLPVPNRWNHLVCVSSGSYTNLYVNGVSSVASPFSLIVANGATPYFAVGGINWPSTGATGFNVLGNIAHVAYYPYVLSVKRIAEHYATGIGNIAYSSPKKQSQYGSQFFGL